MVAKLHWLVDTDIINGPHYKKRTPVTRGGVVFFKLPLKKGGYISGGVVLDDLRLVLYLKALIKTFEAARFLSIVHHIALHHIALFHEAITKVVTVTGHAANIATEGGFSQNMLHGCI